MPEARTYRVYHWAGGIKDCACDLEHGAIVSLTAEDIITLSDKYHVMIMNPGDPRSRKEKKQNIEYDKTQILCIDTIGDHRAFSTR